MLASHPGSPILRRHRFGALLGAALLLAGVLPAAAPAPTSAASETLVINEVDYDQPSTDTAEFLELKNVSGSAIDLGGYTVELVNGTGGGAAPYGTFGLPAVSLAAGDYFVICANATNTANCDLDVSPDTNLIQNGEPDAVGLRLDGVLVDAVSYEGDSGAPYTEGSGTGLVDTAAAGVAQGISRCPDGSDTDQNNADFTLVAATPGAANACAPAAAPVINEFVANHSGTDTSEYLEVFGSPSTSYAAYTILHIEGDTTGAGTIDSVIPVGSTDATGHWATGFLNNTLENGTITLLLVEGFSGTAGTDLDTDNDGTFDSQPWAAIVDDVAVDDGGAGDRTYSSSVITNGYDGLPFLPGGASRIPNGFDTDDLADWTRNDFDLAGLPGVTGTPEIGEALNTPGTSNRLIPTLVINEIDYDQPGTDTAEFIEIKNAHSVAIELDTFSLELVNGVSGGADTYATIDLPAVSLAAGDYFVVCANAATVATCDLDATPDTKFIQNGAPDGVGLLLGEQLIDAVSYEGNTAPPYTEGSGAGLVDDGSTSSIGRCPDGTDTDRNDVDLVLGNPTPGLANDCDDTGPVIGSCGDPATAVHAVQGSGLTSPLLGQTVIVEGVVVGDFQNNATADDGELNGFYVQEEDVEADADPATSEGIFVFAPGGADVSVGDRVRVLGDVAEFTLGGSSMTELTSVAGILVCASGQPVPAPTTVNLPLLAVDDLEAYEGMRVTFPQALTISEYFNYDRFNELVLSLGRQHQPTAVAEPGPDAAAVALANSLARIALDDGRSGDAYENPEVTLHPNGLPFSLANRFRGGDTLTNVTGVLDHGFGLYRVQPTQGAEYAAVNPRTAAPEDVGGSLTVASFNVLNYFTTLTSEGAICGPEANQECRGADTMEEFNRQRAKIIAALAAMDADVVGLIEIENHAGDVPTADLVAGLNEILGAGTYDYVATGGIGTDVIRVALIYKPASVTPVGAFAVLDSSVDPRFNDDHNRPVLAQAFEEVATGGVVTVAVNHLKSKGSACGAGDDDPQQGNCNLTRTLAAQALVDWLATDPTASGDRDALIMGDLNSYDKEDPIDAIRAGADDGAGTGDDWTDLVHEFQGEFAYSYVFDGQLGYLDTALASPTIASQVTGTTIWHINADEPDLLDYDMTFKSDGQDAIHARDPYRSSDHDPVIVGLDLLAFDGFYPPVDNPPAVNEVRAGSVVPLKFGLGGDFGLDVLFEPPQVFACGDWPAGESLDAMAAGKAGLTYDQTEDQYVFPWKTLKEWAGSCRTLEITFVDGSYATASFEFTP